MGVGVDVPFWCGRRSFVLVPLFYRFCFCICCCLPFFTTCLVVCRCFLRVLRIFFLGSFCFAPFRFVSRFLFCFVVTVVFCLYISFMFGWFFFSVFLFSLFFVSICLSCRYRSGRFVRSSRTCLSTFTPTTQQGPEWHR